MNSLATAQSVADVISVISSELPLETSSVFQAAQSTSKTILDSVIAIGNLELLTFLDSRGSTVSMNDFDDLDKHLEYKIFVLFHCSMKIIRNPKLTTIDSKIYY